MCNKIKTYEKEGLNFLLSLPLKHKNHIKRLLLEKLKRDKTKREMINYEYTPVGNTGWLKLTKITNYKKVREGGKVH